MLVAGGTKTIKTAYSGNRCVQVAGVVEWEGSYLNSLLHDAISDPLSVGYLMEGREGERLVKQAI